MRKIIIGLVALLFASNLFAAITFYSYNGIGAIGYCNSEGEAGFQQEISKLSSTAAKSDGVVFKYLPKVPNDIINIIRTGLKEYDIKENEVYLLTFRANFAGGATVLYVAYVLITSNGNGMKYNVYEITAG